VSELQFHHLVLSMIGLAGILWFFGSARLGELWSSPKRAIVGIVSGLIYLAQALSAFANLANASSLELFGFLGCTLGCFGVARIMSGGAISFRRGATSTEA